MSAQSLQVFTLEIPDPLRQDFGTRVQPQRVNSSLSFNYLTSFNIRTLSTDGANHGNDITGLLYVPDLDPTDACINATAPHLPPHVTRRANLPATDYDLIAIAPWITGTCSWNYMKAARADPVRGFLFFLPGNTTNTPPDSNSNQWAISEELAWKDKNDFPVYAINGQSGATLVAASAEYSGNMTDVPNGHTLIEDYGYRPQDFIRLFVDIDTGSGTTLPSLWVFLLVVLGVLLAIIGLTSLSMHLLQRRRRQSLRRRVQNGEVDLEALGIKRLTVPQSLLNQMPLYTYGTVTHNVGVDQDSRTSLVDEEKASAAIDSELSDHSSRPPAVRSHSYRPEALSQPTCPICLDDFVPAAADSPGTIVRELPCHHIFHPECVDAFLRDSSSLCPMCKKTALPSGYCPRIITNAMVRRERLLRRVRERVLENPDAPNGGLPLTFPQRLRALFGVEAIRTGRSVGSTRFLRSQHMSQMGRPGRTTTTSQLPLVRSLSGASATRPESRPVQPPATESHMGWARRRAEEMLGQRAPDDPDAEEARTTSKWRKLLRTLFPRQ